jgi:hypothetical protein
MKGLRTSRVVVVDDDFSEADVLLRGLARLGVGAVYVSGLDPAEYEMIPKVGVRLVFLDLNLTVGGEPLHHAVGVLDAIVSRSTGETGIVCWTKHPEDVPAFTALIEARLSGFKPVFVLSFAKADFGLVSGGVVNVSKLSTEIGRVISENHSFCLVGEWEQFVHDATSSVTSLLARVASPTSGVPLFDLQAVVAKASAGRSCDDERAAVLHFLNGSSEILLDYLYGPAAEGIEPSATTHAFLDRVNARISLSAAMKSGLNKALVTADIRGGDRTVTTGNVYLSNGWDVALAGGFPLVCGDSGVRRFLYDAWPTPDVFADDDAKKTQWKADLRALAPGCCFCLVELTPSCDHAQKKAFFSRLLGGVLLRRPDPISALLSEYCGRGGELVLPAGSRGFCRQFPFVFLNCGGLLASDYSLILDARYLFTVPVAKLSSCSPVFRLRHEVAVDCAAWFAGHASRPGYISVG